MNYSFDTLTTFDPWAPDPDEIEEEVEDFSAEDLQLLHRIGFTPAFIQEVLRAKYYISTFEYFLYMSTVITHSGLAGQLGPRKYHANLAQCRRFICFGALQQQIVAGNPLEINQDNFDIWYPRLRVLVTTTRQEQVEFMVQLHAQYLRIQSQQVAPSSPQSTPTQSAYSGSTVNQQNLTPGTTTAPASLNRTMITPGSQSQYTFEPVPTPPVQAGPTRVTFPDTIPVPASRQQRGGSLSPISQHTAPETPQNLQTGTIPLHTPQVTTSVPMNQQEIAFAFLPHRTDPTFGQVPVQSHPPTPSLLHPHQVTSSEGLGRHLHISLLDLWLQLAYLHKIALQVQIPNQQG